MPGWSRNYLKVVLIIAWAFEPCALRKSVWFDVREGEGMKVSLVAASACESQ